ncbi:MAG TPA: nitrate- and nitrite sensing domain-containing protein [Pseudonocardiaceae bacterium]
MTSPAATRSWWNWRNWPVVVKLVAVLMVPTIVALVAGVLRIVDQASAAPGYIRISLITHVQQQLSDLIGDVQQERDLGTAFVANGRTWDRRPLEQQFRRVDSDAQSVRTATDRIAGLESTGYRTALAQLVALAPLRASVTTGFGPVEVVVAEYGAAIDALIALDVSLTRQLDDVAVANNAAAAQALVSRREQISRQHAIVLAALYANRLNPGQIDDVRTAAVRLATDQDAFRGALAPAERERSLDRVGGDTELARQRLLQLVLNRGIAGDPLNTSPEDWNRRSAAVIGNVAAVERELRQRIDRTALTLRDQVRTAAGVNSVILFFALALGVLVVIVVARALLRPLGVLRRTALDIADRRLPEAMARIRDGDEPEQAIEPVAVTTREEIGQVARAFDEVHSQAVRLAGEQARLRANVNDIFVNLSRRTQGLVERQLQLIDRLESGEQDPEQLDNLFQLDHLATRMRRNSENLLVLAGTDSSNRAGRPVRLVDVLRAAVSEVEQYQRLVLQQPPVVLVLGRTASDLVHLLAELLDNATQFSPPDSHVMVSSAFAEDGSVVIEVMDRGVGMAELELADANRRLASTPVVDVSVSRRMGLFVVGRLSARHGLDVRLGGGEGGVGVSASVTIPPRLVRLVSEATDSRATPVAELPAGNGHARGTAALVAARSADSGGTSVPHAQFDPGPQPDPAGGRGTSGNGNGARSAKQLAPKDPAGGSKLPMRPVNRPVPAGPPPAPPGPPASPVADSPSAADPSTPSGAELFRPGPAAVAGPTAPGSRVTLRNSTPIFDDVASAWFKEHEAVPVRWTAPPSPTPEPPAPPEAPPTPDAPAVPAAAVSPATRSDSKVSATAGPSGLLRRQPGKALAESFDSGTTLTPVQPAVAARGSSAPAEAPGEGWGAADEGWRAAEALATPVPAEVTPAGLPRRQPRALLVPGAAGGSGSAQPTTAPVRSAEAIRGRLASYQQGIREGRQSRSNPDQGNPDPGNLDPGNLDQDASGSAEQ